MSIMVFTMGLMPLGVLPVGLVVDLVGIRPTVAALAVGMLATSTWVLASQKRVRELA